MDTKNISFITEFILVGLTEYTETHFPFFFLFLGIYVITVAGNLGLLTLIGMNSPLHTPMYYFLFNLSFIDLCYSTVITPKLLVNFVSEKNTISYEGCMTQLYFYCFFVSAECYVLTVMAYDRYVAICKPLLYTVTMSPQHFLGSHACHLRLQRTKPHLGKWFYRPFHTQLLLVSW